MISEYNIDKKLNQFAPLGEASEFAVFENGGKGSGNFGHAGRPGQVGGSGDGYGSAKQDRRVKSMKPAKSDAYADGSFLSNEKEYFEEINDDDGMTADEKFQAKKEHFGDLYEEDTDNAKKLIKKAQEMDRLNVDKVSREEVADYILGHLFKEWEVSKFGKKLKVPSPIDKALGAKVAKMFTRAYESKALGSDSEISLRELKTAAMSQAISTVGYRDVGYRRWLQDRLGWKI